MATVTHVSQENRQGVPYRLITIGPITNSNTASDWVDIRGWKIVSVDWQGTAGSTPSLVIQGSNNFSSTSPTGTTISTFTAAAAGWIGAAGNIIAPGKIIAKLASGGDGTTSMTAYILLVKA